MSRRDRDDDWPEEPDPWETSDREWKQKWDPTPESDDYAAPLTADAPEASGGGPGPGYVPRRASAGNVIDSYEAGMREAGPYLTIGLQIALSMLVFVGGGWAVDGWLGTTPWGVIVGAVLGFAGVIGLVIRLASEADAAKRQARAREPRR